MLKHLIQTARPSHYVKNLFVFAALIFARQFFDVPSIIDTLLTFVSFCLAASAVYFFNDIFDREEDRNHPVKQHRPIAAGQISVQAGFTAYFSLLVVSTAIPLLLINPAVTLIILGYHVLNVLYSWKLKHIVIVDLLVIAADFILRVIAGGLAIGAPISNWLLMCVLLLALFLAVAKRREELIRTNISNENDSTRKVLDDYSERLLDQMLAIVAGLTIISYSLYTILNENFNHLLYTVPFVLYGIFRYLYIIYQKAGGANPEKEMLHDKHILFTIFLWIVTVLVIIVFCQ